MFDRVVAVRYIQAVGTGRTQPVLCECERACGALVEVVIKHSAGECTVGGLVREAIAAMLAADLGLPIPEPFCVDLLPEFVATLPDGDAKRNLGRSVSPVFGSGYVPAAAQAVPAFALSPQLRQQAAEIAAFDALVFNADRTERNANCLTTGLDLVMIDHELALEIELVGSMLQPFPWSQNGLQHLRHSQPAHLFLNRLRGHAPSLDDLQHRWSSIDSARVRDYVASIPAEWNPGSTATRIADYLNELYRNLPAAFDEVRRVLM